MAGPYPTDTTARAATFIETLAIERIPSEALRIGQRCVLDGLAVMVAGIAEDSHRLLMEEALALGGRKDALLLGAGRARVPAPMAARVLGAAGHAHDWDDTQVSNDPRHQYGLLTHPTVPPLAAALAVAQMLGAQRRRVSGADFMTAFMAGFEVESKISEWLLPFVYRERSFHSSGVVGLFGAAAAAGKLLGLDHQRLRMALSICVSLAAGCRVNFGTMSKPLQVARAAENGVTAALLAARGYTADPDGLDGEWGFFRVYGDGCFPEKLAQGYGGEDERQWSIVSPGVSIKPWPSGILTHQTMDAMLELMRAHSLAPRQIDRVDVYAGSNVLNPIRYAVAKTHLQAKFSMAALLAMMILRGRAGRREFTDEFIGSPEVQDMQSRIRTHVDPAIEAQGMDIIRSRIELTTSDGRRLVQWAPEAYRGGPRNPMTEDELAAKLAACAEGILDAARQARLVRAVRRVTKLADAALLAKLIQP
jgi:2-methylcitrate dehydratase PrpD